MKLSSAQEEWLRRFLFNRRYPGMYAEFYEFYRKLGGRKDSKVYAHFLSRDIGRKGKKIASLPDNEAILVIRSIGIAPKDLREMDAVMQYARRNAVAGLLCADKRRMNDTQEDSGELFFKSCVSILWMSEKKDSSSSLKTNDKLLQLLDSIVENAENLSTGQKRIVFGELYEYLMENRQYDRWGRWISSFAREYRRYFCKHLGKGCSNWFPGCIVKDDGTIDVNEVEVNKLTQDELDEMAFFVCWQDMSINNIRYSRFSHTVKIERLTTKIAMLKKDLGEDSTELMNAEADLKVEKIARERDRNLLKIAFNETRHYIKPVWNAIKESKNSCRWLFLLMCARLFHDLARYHYYSSLKCDRRESVDIYRDIEALAEMANADVNVGMKIKSQFNYLASAACRYIAEANSANNSSVTLLFCDATDYIKRAIQYADKALAQVRCSGGKEKVQEYRAKRNLARILTFAIRWWLKHDQPNILFEVDASATKMKDIEEVYHDCISQFVSKEQNLNDKEIVSGKIKLEWEFHLRVQIECMTYLLTCDILPKLKKLQTLFQKSNALNQRFLENNKKHIRIEEQRKIQTEIRDINARINCQKNHLEDAETAFCLIVAIYCYLFSARKGEVAEHRPFTHISRDIESKVIRWLNVYSSSDIFTFDYSFLSNIKQVEPPSLSSQLETLYSVLDNVNNHRGQQINKMFYNGLESLLELRMDERDIIFNDIYVSVKSAMLQDKRYILNEFQSEKNQFGSVTKDNLKEYPLYRHRSEMIYGPGSNASDIDKMFKELDLNWNPVKMEIFT